jgi:hypothetical protein
MKLLERSAKLLADFLVAMEHEGVTQGEAGMIAAALMEATMGPVKAAVAFMPDEIAQAATDVVTYSMLRHPGGWEAAKAIRGRES